MILAEAAQQRAETRALMQRAPQAVFDVAMGLAEHDALPKELQPYFPVIFSGRGNLDNLWETGLCAHGSKHCHGTSILRLPGETLHLHQGAKGLVPVLHDVPVAGVRLGKDAVLATGASLPLEPKDLVFLGAETATMQDPLTGRAGKPQHTLYFAGQALLFESASTQAAFADAYAEAIARASTQRRAHIIDPFPVLAGDSGGTSGGSRQATPYLQNQIDVLFIRVDFSDFPGAPVSQTDLEASLAEVNTHIANFSYAQAGIDFTVTETVYRMPDTGENYAQTGDNDGLLEDAKLLAAADFTLGNYDVVAVFFRSYRA